MTAASGPDWGELERRFAPAPEPFWERCGCLEGLGEIPSVSDCHQAGLCRVRQRDRERDEAFAVLLAAARGRDRLAAAITALADELARDAQSARNDARAIGPGGDSEQATYWHSQADAASDAAARLRALLTTTDEGETK